MGTEPVEVLAVFLISRKVRKEAQSRNTPIFNSPDVSTTLMFIFIGAVDASLHVDNVC